ncbi:MAG: LPS export ABC transporter periplasmic protein LptC [Gammaproteobacteria bacterium]|jgi:LPS export ABC transporter protein LptC
MQRIKFILIPGILATLMFLGIDFFTQNREASNTPAPTSTINYDGYSEGISSVHFDEHGRIRYTLQASRQISYVEAETALEEPFIQLYRENDSRWNIVARSGKIFTGNQEGDAIEQIILDGDVEVYQLDDSGNRTVLLTQTLSVDPTRDVLTTEADVSMVGEDFEQSATGMRVNLDTEEYIFHRDVRGRYAASQH